MINYKLCLFPLLLGLVVGCGRTVNLGVTLPDGRQLSTQEIATIQAEQKSGKTVYLRGEVKKQAPFLDSGAYQLEDQTGEIWVVTTGDLPEVGTKVALKGKVIYQSIPVEQQDWGEMYVEQKWRLRLEEEESGD